MLGLLSRPLRKLRPSRPPLLALFTFASLILIYFWRLGSWVGGYSPAEAKTISLSHGLQSLLDNPINAPHNFFLYLLQKVNYTDPFLMRGVSAVLALIFIVCFYKIARSWFGPFIGWVSTLFMATTPLMILAGRSATADIMFLSPLAVAGIYFWITRSKEPSRLAYLALLIVSALALYTPGIVWLLILGVVVARSNLKKLIKAQPRWLNALGVLLGLLLLSPLGLTAVGQPQVILNLLMIPDSLPQVLTAIKTTAWMILGLFWQTGTHHDLQIDRLPLLNLTQTVLVIFGIYAFWSRARDKIYGLMAMGVIGVLGAGINDNVAFLLFALPPACLLAAAGLRYLHLEWQGVFPRNPLPRALAVVLMFALVGMNLYYGVRYSLAGWPYTVATKSTYVIKYPQ